MSVTEGVATRYPMAHVRFPGLVVSFNGSSRLLLYVECVSELNRGPILERACVQDPAVRWGGLHCSRGSLFFFFLNSCAGDV